MIPGAAGLRITPRLNCCSSMATPRGRRNAGWGLTRADPYKGLTSDSRQMITFKFLATWGQCRSAHRLGLRARRPRLVEARWSRSMRV